jgi:hypothetical protein
VTHFVGVKHIFTCCCICDHLTALNLRETYLIHKYIEKIKFRNNFDNLFAYLKYKPLYMVRLIDSASFYNDHVNGENGGEIRQNLLTKRTYSVSEARTANYDNSQRDVNGDQGFSPCRFNVQTLISKAEMRLKECEST